MVIPKVEKQDIIKAMRYIDEHKVPFHNQSTTFDLVVDGKRYPPKYLMAVANHFATGADISAEGISSSESRDFFAEQGFTIETKQKEKFKLLRITRDSFTSTDEQFTIDNIDLGDKYMPLDVYFKKADGTVIRRTLAKGEKIITNQTLPRLAFQVFEKRIIALSPEEKENFPIVQIKSDKPVTRGIYSSEDEFKSHHGNTIQYLNYNYGDGRRFVIYCWNMFSTLLFVQECLKRFGEPGDEFILAYKEKKKKESEQPDKIDQTAQPHKIEYKNPYSSLLLESKNLIFRGAPGTGKSYLARQIAADIVSDGETLSFASLTAAQKQQVEFVQFHPSYDYSDFVEGLRPFLNDDNTMGFRLQKGIFKEFAERARRNFENSQKTLETLENELSAQEAMEEFFSDVKLNEDKFETVTHNEFTITDVSDDKISIFIPSNDQVKNLTLNMDEIRKMLESGQEFTKIKDITKFFNKQFATQQYSYDFALYKEIKKKKRAATRAAAPREELKKYVFIIDEINRGEISKIFGELFFAVDPDYRGPAGEVSTQYANMHSDPNEKFYIPENVYIIGTMNDIDRSVDSFDFAMRRRFRFVELRANEQIQMLDALDESTRAEAVARMTALNNEIVKVEDLNENYQIGASYFLKLKTLTFDKLWTDYLRPLLREYVQGMYGEEEIMARFAKAYGYKTPEGAADETAQD